jgi:hypothetical protein
MGARGVLRTIGGGDLGFWCPGCEKMHVVSSGWTFDGNYDAPTFNPSVLVRNGHFASDHASGAACEPRPSDPCWCTFNAKEIAEGREPSAFTCSRCHSFVRGGQIRFLSDSTHALAGQTVAMQPMEADAP